MYTNLQLLKAPDNDGIEMQFREFSIHKIFVTMENYQNYIAMYRCSQIVGRRSRNMENYGTNLIVLENLYIFYGTCISECKI